LAALYSGEVPILFADIKFHNVSGNICTEERYEISVEASGSDGEELYYRWSLNHSWFQLT